MIFGLCGTPAPNLQPTCIQTSLGGVDYSKPTSRTIASRIQTTTTTTTTTTKQEHNKNITIQIHSEQVVHSKFFSGKSVLSCQLRGAFLDGRNGLIQISRLQAAPLMDPPRRGGFQQQRGTKTVGLTSLEPKHTN